VSLKIKNHTPTDLRLVNSTDEFKSLQHEWDTLYEKCQQSTIFSSWDWMFSWWEIYGDLINSKLTILCLYKDNKIVGIAPFQILNIFPKSLVQGKTLCFLGTGEKKCDGVVSQFIDFIVEPELEIEMVEKVSEYLLKNKQLWDFADFEFLLEDALIFKCFNSAKSKISRKKINYGVRFSVPEMESFEDYQSQLGNRWRKMFAKKSRTLEKDGEIRIESTQTVESIEPAFKLLAEMHNARWNDRSNHSIFHSPHFCSFHLKVMRRLLPKKKVFIKTLYKDDEAMACYYCFTDKNQIHYYQSGFFTKYANRYSPLFLLVCSEIGEAIKSKMKFDFMYSDDAESYKKEQYAAEHEPMYRLRWSIKLYRFYLFDGAKFVQNTILKTQKAMNNKKAKA